MKWPCVFCFLSIASPAAASCNPPPGAIVTVDAVEAISKISGELKTARKNLLSVRDAAKRKQGNVMLIFDDGIPEHRGGWYNSPGNMIYSSDIADVSEFVAQILDRKIESQEQQLCALGVRP